MCLLFQFFHDIIIIRSKRACLQLTLNIFYNYMNFPFVKMIDE
jgi:hypothetical protein